MKNSSLPTKLACSLFLSGVSLLLSSFIVVGTLAGAYEATTKNGKEVIIFQDGYFMHSSFDANSKEFLYSEGGTFSITADSLITNIEFSTRSKESVGIRRGYGIVRKNKVIEIEMPDGKLSFQNVDNGDGPLAGNWRITGRKQDGNIRRMQRSPRKTLKILSGTRFQWAAINPQTKEFFGTGGGTYTFKNGKYTENIEFFSRDNSRVGASLAFDGEVKENEWHHSGLSSKGDPIYEIWSREKPD